MSARTVVPEHDIDAAGARLAILIGLALTAGSLLAAIMLVFWLQASPFRLDFMGPWAFVAIGAAIVMAGLCVWQLLAWRAHPEIPRASTGPLGTGASWWVHVGSYAVALLGMLGAVIVMAWTSVTTLGFWLAFAAGLLLIMGQVVGATQFLRDRGLPGTLGRHVRTMVRRGNERADAALDAEDDDEPWPGTRVTVTPRDGEAPTGRVTED